MILPIPAVHPEHLVPAVPLSLALAGAVLDKLEFAQGLTLPVLEFLLEAGDGALRGRQLLTQRLVGVRAAVSVLARRVITVECVLHLLIDHVEHPVRVVEKGDAQEDHTHHELRKPSAFALVSGPMSGGGCSSSP